MQSPSEKQEEMDKKVDVKVVAIGDDAYKPNEGGDCFLPKDAGTASQDGIIEEQADFPHDGCKCDKAHSEATGPSGSKPRATGPSGNPINSHNFRRIRHQRRHNGRVIAAPGLAVICPLGSQLKANKHPGPNDPCPCKSGKKYKKCCLNKE